MTQFFPPVSPSAGGDSADRTLERVRFFGFCLTLIGTAVSISLTSIGSVIYAAGLAAAAVKRSPGLPRFPFLPLGTAVMLAVTASAAVNHFPAESWQGMLKYLWGFLLLYAGMDAARGRARVLALLVLGCAGAAAVSGIGQDVIGRDFINGRAPVLYTAAVTRITGPFKHCNDFATFLIPGWLFGCARVVGGFRRAKPAVIAAGTLFLAVLAWALFRTMSRSAMIGAGAGMAVLAMTLPYRRWIWSVLVACAAAAWLAPSVIATRLHQLSDLGGGLHERVYLIRAALKMIRSAPWLGLGPNTYSKWFPVFNPPDPSAPVIMYAHNSYLQIATETGWIGLTLYLAFILAALIRSWRTLDRLPNEEMRWIRSAALASAAGLLVNALFESLLQSTQLRAIFWSVLGIALAQLTAPPAAAPARKKS